MSNHLKSNTDDRIVLDVTPESAGWQYLVVSHRQDQCRPSLPASDRRHRTRLGPACRGRGGADGRGRHSPSNAPASFKRNRRCSMFRPARNSASSATAASNSRIGAAPAEGRYPLRLFRPDEIRSEVRGGGRSAASGASHAGASDAGRAADSVRSLCAGRRLVGLSAALPRWLRRLGASGRDLLLPHRPGQRRGAASQLSARYRL